MDNNNSTELESKVTVPESSPNRYLPVPKPTKYKKSVGDKVFAICNIVFMVLFVVITIYPILNTLAISFNDGIDAVRGGIHIFPRKFSLNNYSVVFKQQNIKTALLISVLRTVIGTALGVVANAILAFLVIPIDIIRKVIMGSGKKTAESK